jgi:hypothetical protein
MARPAFHNRTMFSRGVNAGMILRYGVAFEPYLAIK